MNKRIQTLIVDLTDRFDMQKNEAFADYIKVLVEIVVKECADAADMAYDARCIYPGDYVGEQMGFGEEHGIAAWRSER